MSWRSLNAVSPSSIVSQNDSGLDSWGEKRLPKTLRGSLTGGNSSRWGDPAFLVGYDGQLLVRPLIFKKSFPDTSWQKVIINYSSRASFSLGSLDDVAVPSAQVVYCCGDMGVILKTADNGTPGCPNKQERLKVCMQLTFMRKIMESQSANPGPYCIQKMADRIPSA